MTATPPRFELDEQSHIYKLDGRIIPSVTQILKAEGFIDGDFHNTVATDRGTKVHQAIQYFTEGDLDESSVDEEIAGYLEAWKSFLAAKVFTPEWAERRFWSHNGYAGTLDQFGTFAGGAALIDIKTGPWQPWHDLQLAAYATLLPAPPVHTRILQLSRDGKFKLHPPKTPMREAKAVFLAAVQSFNWKERNGYHAADRNA